MCSAIARPSPRHFKTSRGHSWTMDDDRRMQNEDLDALHRSLAAVSGAVGGGLGLAALALELPVSTVIMLRSIMAIARDQGEDIDNPETAFASLQVFALGARVGEGDPLGNGYF